MVKLPASATATKQLQLADGDVVGHAGGLGAQERRVRTGSDCGIRSIHRQLLLARLKARVQAAGRSLAERYAEVGRWGGLVGDRPCWAAPRWWPG